MRSTWPGQNVTQMSWMIHTQPTYDPELSIENTIIFISKMCGCVDTLHTTHYMYIQDMLGTVLAFQVTTLCMDQSTMLHSAHQ